MRTLSILCMVAWAALSPAPASSQLAADNDVLSEQKISSTDGGLTDVLGDGDQFGRSIAVIGDLDGDLVDDVAVGAPNLPVFGDSEGSVWILFMNANGTVKSRQQIGEGVGGFAGSLDLGDQFGISVAPLGLLDGDSVPDLAVGAAFDGDGGFARGAVWVLFMNANGTVKSSAKISDTSGGFTGTLENSDLFGYSLAALGTPFSGGETALAVGAPGDDDGGPNRGAVWILGLTSAGAVGTIEQKLSDTVGDFAGTLADDDQFGTAVAGMGDLDGPADASALPGVQLSPVALAVGAPGVHMFPFEPREGTVWVLRLSDTGSSYDHTEVTEGTLDLDGGDQFGSSLASVLSSDGNHQKELVVGSIFDDSGTSGGPGGAIWLLCFKNDATVFGSSRISQGLGGFVGPLDDDDFFGGGVAALGDLDGSGGPDLMVGAFLDDDGGTDRGAVYTLFMDEAPDATIELFNGCGTNPADSVAFNVSNVPSFGETVTITFQNLEDTQGDGDVVVFPSISGSESAFFPFEPITCGALIAGYGMSGTGPGEYVHSLTQFSVLPFTVWSDPGNPHNCPPDCPSADLLLPIPYDCSLVGAPLYVQATLWDPPPMMGMPDGTGLLNGEVQQFAVTAGVKLVLAP